LAVRRRESVLRNPTLNPINALSIRLVPRVFLLVDILSTISDGFLYYLSDGSCDGSDLRYPLLCSLSIPSIFPSLTSEPVQIACPLRQMLFYTVHNVHVYSTNEPKNEPQMHQHPSSVFGNHIAPINVYCAEAYRARYHPRKIGRKCADDIELALQPRNFS
jgi:hypothetical protein